MNPRIHSALSFRSVIQAAYSPLTGLSNNDIIKNHAVYDFWSPNSVSYTADKSIVRVIEDGSEELYLCIFSHVSQENYKPSQATASLWTHIDQEHSGTIDDPIPAKVNMVYYKDKYYEEEGVLYLCIRDSETPLQYLPSALVGNYFTKVE